MNVAVKCERMHVVWRCMKRERMHIARRCMLYDGCTIGKTQWCTRGQRKAVGIPISLEQVEHVAGYHNMVQH